MASKTQGVRGRLLATTLFAGVATIAAPATVALVAAALPTMASAQDYTSGTLTGTVSDTGGSPVAGATVTVTSVAQGFTRTATTDADGQFRVPLIPIGSYRVAINANGYEPVTDSTATVRLGGESAYTFTLTTPGEVSELVITSAASPALDFAATTTGLTVDVEDLAKQVPIARNITAVTMLAPTAVQGESLFGNQPTIGGASVAENAFYVNGLNITNFDSYVGGATVPFEFYKSVEVKTGGYPAEFGRATGGVINAVTKSGTNDFMFALHGNWEPAEWASKARDTYLARNRIDYDMRKDLTVEAGGPIIRDRLFAYGLYQFRESDSRAAGITTRQYNVDTSDDPFWGVKLDGYITDEHRLEFTYFDTSRETQRDTYRYTRTDDVISDNTIGGAIYEFGGPSWVARYTGQFTDWLTLSAAYGVSEDRDSFFSSVDPTISRVIDYRSGTAITVGPQTNSYGTDEIETKREFYRVDADIYFSLMGDHHVRMGYDNEQTTLFHANILAGPGVAGGLIYVFESAGDDPVNGDLLPAGELYADVVHLLMGGSEVEGENQSFYIQDAWDITPNLSLQLGLRYDEFQVSNLSGETAVDLKDNWGPRIGFTWDPTGDRRDKVYGSYGRYFIPPASNLSFRGRDLYFEDFFRITSFDPATGAVVLGEQLTTTNAPNLAGFGASECPAGGYGATNAVGCLVYGNGSQEPAFSKTALDLKATYEDEFIIGYQRRMDDLWTVGARLTYRTLGDVSEDVAIDQNVIDYCVANGIAGCGSIWFGDYQYVVLNPGQTVQFYTRDPLPGQTAPTLITLTAEELGYPEPKREYLAFELSFERAFDGVWSLQGSYVASESEGNYEGTVRSEEGQTDAGSTVLFDHIGLQDYAYGLLPNHRGHQFKMFGSYQVTEQLLVGGNLSVTSPRPYGCRGLHPTEPDARAYGAASWFCRGEPTPRGSQMESDWITRFDVSARYTVPSFGFVPGELTLRADIFNVFNLSGITELEEEGDIDPSGAANPNYGLPVGYQTPRYVRIGFDWEF